VVRLTDDDKPLQEKGCLQVGLRGDTIKAHFFSLKRDQARLADEQKRGCRAVVSQGTEPPTKIGNILLRFLNFVPSDIKNPAGTMLRIEGTVGVKILGTSGFTSQVIYQIRPHNSDGSWQKIAMRPAFRGLPESLRSAFERKNPEGIKVGPKGDVIFDVTDISNPSLAYAAYEIFDQDNQVVGAIDFPVYVSGAR
jgi:hypothetical protein